MRLPFSLIFHWGTFQETTEKGNSPKKKNSLIPLRLSICTDRLVLSWIQNGKYCAISHIPRNNHYLISWSFLCLFLFLSPSYVSNEVAEPWMGEKQAKEIINWAWSQDRKGITGTTECTALGKYLRLSFFYNMGLRVTST